MTRDHRFYEMQSALSATGHLTGAELEELEQHVSQCVSCRDCLVEMAAASRELSLGRSDRATAKLPGEWNSDLSKERSRRVYRSNPKGPQLLVIDLLVLPRLPQC